MSKITEEVSKTMRVRMAIRAFTRTGIECFVGIDISKKSLDVCILGEKVKAAHRLFANSTSGFAELLAWCGSRASLDTCHFCLESTGTYGLGIAGHLADSGHLVSVENPRFIKHFAIGKKIQNKTDRSDSFAIARYCQENELRPWSLQDPALRELDLLLKRLFELGKLEQQEANRLECTFLPKCVRNSVSRMVGALQAEAEIVTKELEERLSQKPQVQGMLRALIREAAVGELTALRILSHMGWDPLNFENAQQVGAAAGLNPVRRESGLTKAPTHISKHGNPDFRAQLHMVAVVAAHKNERVKAFYQKRLAGGMPKLAAITACARKLLMICYGILRAHLRGDTPVYSSAKLRYTNLRGRIRVIDPKKKRAKALTV